MGSLFYGVVTAWCFIGEYPFPWLSVVTSEPWEMPIPTPAPQIPPPASLLYGAAARLWAALLPGGALETHNAASLAWIPSAFSMQRIIQEIPVSTFEECPGLSGTR